MRSRQSLEQTGFSVVGVRFNGANDDTGASCNENIAGANVRAEREVNVRQSMATIGEATDGGDHRPVALYGIVHSVKRKVTEVLFARNR